MHVTSHSEEHVDRNPFPELHFPRAPIPAEDEAASVTNTNDSVEETPESHLSRMRPGVSNTRQSSDIVQYRYNEDRAAEEAKKDSSAVEHVPEAMAEEDTKANDKVRKDYLEVARSLFIPS
jgi:Tfp pilus assembly protein PilX